MQHAVPAPAPAGRTARRVVVALSGGVDSSVAAALLARDGFEVVGVTLKLWDYPPEVEGGCCTATDVADARRLAADLGFPHYVLDERDVFRDRVVDPFVRASLAGVTPSPCVTCNQAVKFGRLLTVARGLGAGTLATGHYARIAEAGGRHRLYRARDRARDQSYFLHGLPAASLAGLRFPLGDMTKEDVRSFAKRTGIRGWDKPDSQDLCFLDGRTAPEFVEQRAGASAAREGVLVDRDGRVLGRHPGVHRFTVGQRRGLGLGGGGRFYVLAIDAGSGEVRVGDGDALACAGLHARDFAWLRAPFPSEALSAQVRSRAPAVPARVEDLADGRVRVRFGSPLAAVAPGQAVVIYSGDEVLGGGTIDAREAAGG